MAKTLSTVDVRALLGRVVGETALNITSSTNASPSVVTIAAHGLSTDDLVFVINHATNTNLNGVRKVVAIDANTFSLTDLAGAAVNGNGVGGATGTVQRVASALRPGDLEDLAAALDKRSSAQGPFADNNRAAEASLKTIFGV